MTKHQGFCIFLFLYETTLLQVICRGAPCGYPKISAFTSLCVLVQDVSKLIEN
jgi:hypothetical protein